jgi:hypothetical protein
MAMPGKCVLPLSSLFTLAAQNIVGQTDTLQELIWQYRLDRQYEGPTTHPPLQTQDGPKILQKGLHAHF